MDSINLNLLSLAVAFFISYMSIPVVRLIAFKIGAIDVPKDGRRMHKVPVPRMGGLSIYFGFIISYLCFSPAIEMKHLGILAGATILVITGVIDDKYAIRASVKLLFQLIAAIIPVVLGLRIEFLTNPGFWGDNAVTMLGILSIPITVIWIIGLTNALNLIDGLDGLAGGITVISAICLMIVAISSGSYSAIVPLAAIAGATLGFLPYNMNPAKIFMGDTGALFLGYMLATLSVDGFFKSFTAINFLIPFIVFGLPIFDTSFAILRRIAHKKPIMAPDRSHLHHRLVDSGFSQREAVGVLYSISGLLSLTSIVWVTEGWKRMLVMLCVTVIYCVAIRFYSHNRNCETEFMDNLNTEENLQKGNGDTNEKN